MNGSSTVLADTEAATERTPLLTTGTRGADHETTSDAELPFVEPTVERLRASGSHASLSRDWAIESFQDHALKSAFRLVVLLLLRANPTNRHPAQVLEQWEVTQENAMQAENLQDGILDVWNGFLGHCNSDDDIDVVLWTRFPLNEHSRGDVSVADLLLLPASPREILTHPIIMLSLHKAWCKGLQVHRDQQSAVDLVFNQVHKLSPARVLHLLDLVLNLTYLIAIASYAVFPPILPVEEDLFDTQAIFPGFREIFLMLYSFAQICKLEAFTIAPFILTLLALLSSLPSVPMSTDAAYSAILMALSLHVVQLHFPLSPSPMHFLPCSYAMPLSTLIWHGVSEIFFPVLLFFLPALLLSLFLLSTSLSDAMLHFASHSIVRQLVSSPLEARTAFLTLFIVFFALMICSLVLLILAYPTFSSSSLPNPWDRYSAPIGADARKYTIRLLQTYTAPCMFPAPLNIVQLTFIQIPTFFLYKLGRKKRPLLLDTLERTLWIVLVSPWALFLGIFWLWGYAA